MNRSYSPNENVDTNDLPRNQANYELLNQRWKEIEKPKVMQLFTKRIRKELEKLTITPNEKDVADITNGKGLFLHGQAGTGKTLYGCAVMIEALRRLYTYPGLTRRFGKFVNILNLLEEIRASFNIIEKDKESIQRTTHEILDYYNNIGVLLLDDLGTERPTGWSLQILQIIVNNRYENILPTIITSNLNLNEISKQLDDRIASRICEMCRPVSFKDQDYRLK